MDILYILLLDSKVRQVPKDNLVNLLLGIFNLYLIFRFCMSDKFCPSLYIASILHRYPRSLDPFYIFSYDIT